MYSLDSRRKSSKKFIKLRCNPKKKTSKNNSDTCLDTKTIFRMKALWNKRHPDRQIKKRRRRDIWKDMKKNLADSCSHEMCWIEKTFDSVETKELIRKELFIPQMPESWRNNPTEWLSSVDISDVLKQYEEKHRDFKFIGPSPIDFDSMDTISHRDDEICVWPELCDFELSYYIKNGIRKVGFVFNTDKHYHNGSHWISLYIDLDDKIIYFFDSAGTKPPIEIVRLIRKIKKQGKNYHNLILIDKSNHPQKHQKENTECGMYSLFFIISLLDKSLKFNDFNSKKFPDYIVKRYRTIYFNKLQ